MKLCLFCDHAFESEDWKCPNCSSLPAYIDGHLAFAPDLARSNDGYDSELFAEITSAQDENFWSEARQRLFIWALSHYFPQAASFLEIGSAKGFILNRFRSAFPQLALWGSDIYVAGLDFIKRQVSEVHVFQADARHIPFCEEFDVIGAFDVLEHIDDDEQVLGELYKATKPNGGILVSVPQHPFLWSQRDEYLCHKRRYTRRELVEKVRKAGFGPLRTTSFISLPFPAMVLSALRNRKPRENYDPFVKLKIGAMRSRILNVMLSSERQMIKAGVSFPFGGSLLLVAQRGPV